MPIYAMDFPFIREYRNKGRMEGMTEILIRQARARYGRLPRWASDRIHKASRADLLHWGVAVLHAESLEELLGPPEPGTSGLLHPESR